ncbi:MAG: LysR substrate-binding domain-containing protein [Granulosicoccus sp.]
MQTSSGEFLRSAAVDSLGIAQLPSFIVFKEIELGTLVPVLNDYQRTDLNAYAIYPPTHHLSQRVRAFVDFLLSHFEDVLYWDQCLSVHDCH